MIEQPNIPLSLDERRIRILAAGLNITDSKAVLQYGIEPQRKVTETAERLLKNIQLKDSGAGELLTRMISTLKNFQHAEAELRKKPSLLDKLRGKPEPIIAFRAQYNSVNEHIDTISNALEKAKQQLLTDITNLDKLYDHTLDYYIDLEHHIAAGEQILRHADEHTLPVLKQKAQTSGQFTDSQRVHDYQTRRDELDRRLHDLRLTRQITMQALPNLRLIQDNDKSLVTKINSTLNNTIPLWRQQLAQAIALHHSQQANDILKASNDLTNDLLTHNATTLEQSNQAIRTQTKRGTFDIEQIETANRSLINTLEESLNLTENARAQRQAAESRLQQAENNLKTALQTLSQKKNQK